MEMTNEFRQYDTGIVLSGGAIRGLAHPGVYYKLKTNAYV